MHICKKETKIVIILCQTPTDACITQRSFPLSLFPLFFLFWFANAPSAFFQPKQNIFLIFNYFCSKQSVAYFCFKIIATVSKISCGKAALHIIVAVYLRLIFGSSSAAKQCQYITFHRSLTYKKQKPRQKATTMHNKTFLRNYLCANGTKYPPHFEGLRAKILQLW